MALFIYPKSKQANGQFNNGEIKEKKPIGFPQDGGNLQPYSSLFYWAHAWAEKDSTIAEHPHKGFEILTFVLHGEIEHYDNKYKIWRKLNAGDVQIIKSGNGITHAESMNQNSQIFQIWFDPDLSQTINKDAEYKDYSSEKFPILIDEGKSSVIYVGESGPISMDTEGVRIREISLSEGEHEIHFDNEKVISAFLIEGEIEVQNKSISKGDFFIIKRQTKEKIKTIFDSRIFIIETPASVSYKTYAEMHDIQNKW